MAKREAAPFVVAVAGQKGGVGKSTLAINLAAEWHARGRRVLLADGDPQATCRTWREVAAEAGHDGPTVIGVGQDMHKAEQLPRLAEGFDACVIDCPPRHNATQRAALMVADLVLLPCGVGGADLWALTAAAELVTEAQTVRPNLKAAIVIARKPPRSSLGRSVRAAVAELALPVMRTDIYQRIAYAEAVSAGQGVTLYEPHGTAAVEVRLLTDEIEDLLSERSKAT